MDWGPGPEAVDDDTNGADGPVDGSGETGGASADTGPGDGTDDGETTGQACGGIDDPKNCGTCGHDCEGGACVDAQCQPFLIASGFEFPNHLAVHGDTLFVSTDTGLFAVPKSGGVPTQLATGLARGIVADDERVYWVDEASSTIESAPLDGGLATTLVGFITDPWALAADDTHLYWIDGGVIKLAKAGGLEQVIVPAAQDGFVPWQLAVGGGRVYWRTDEGLLRSSDTNGNDHLTLASGNEMHAVAFNGSHVFAMRQDGTNQRHTLLRIPSAGGAPEELISDQPGVFPLAANANAVYWRTTVDDVIRIVGIPVDGGPASIIATFTGGSVTITTSDTSVYWAENNSVMKLVQ